MTWKYFVEVVNPGMPDVEMLGKLEVTGKVATAEKRWDNL